MIHDEAIARLARDPLSWRREDLQRMQKYFSEARPDVPAELVIALWKYWQTKLPDKLLFSDAEDNVALFLHARVYGQTLNSVLDNTALDALLKQYRGLYTKPLKAYPAWDTDAAFSDRVSVGLTSPIISVFISSENEVPQQVLIIGEGIPEIRERVYPAAFMASLRIHGLANDMMHAGLMRVELPGVPTTPLPLPFEIIGNRRGRLGPERLPAAEDALRELIALLRQIEQDTGLLRIYEVEAAQQKSLTDSLRTQAQQLKAGHARLWIAAQAFDDSSASRPDTPELVALTPFWQLTNQPGPLSMTLSADILRTATYLGLQAAYQEASIDRILIDLDARAEHYRYRREYYEAEKRRYDAATALERQRIWGSTIIATHKFNMELGVDISLTEPEELPRDHYFTINVPWLINSYREWQYRAEDIATALRNVARRQDAPVRRFAAARFLDAALRDYTLAESKPIQQAYNLWREPIQSLLWFEWRCLLKKHGIPPKIVFTTHTFFHTWFTLQPDSAEFDHLIIAPLSIFDRKRSAALFDTDNGVMSILDPSDYARPRHSQTKEDALLARLMGIAQDDSVEETHIWSELVRLAGDPATTAEQFVELLSQTLHSSPSEVVNRGMATILDESGEAPAQNESTPEQVELDRLLTKSLAAVSPARRLRRAYQLATLGGLHSARELLSDISTEPAGPAWLVRQWLVRSLIECMAAGLRYDHALPRAYPKRLSELPESVRAALNQAMACDREFVQEWLNILAQSDRSTALDKLWHIAEQHDAPVVPEQRAVLLARNAVELVQIARQLQSAINSIDEQGLPRDVALLRLGSAIEQAFLTSYSEPRLNEIYTIIEALTAAELPRLRRSRI